METKQTVVWKGRIRCLILYRGGYDLNLDEGSDPYSRDTNPISTAKGYSPTYPIKSGCLISVGGEYAHQTKEDMLRFFFGEIPQEVDKIIAVETELKICFDAVGRMVIYKKGEPDPVRVSKLCETRKSKFYKTWIQPYTEYGDSQPPVTVKGWKFAKGQDFIIASTPHFFDELVPEYGLDKKWEEPLESWRERLYATEPIDLSESWDYTEEEKKEIDSEVNKIKEERERARAELEERKATPGYCDCCGEPAAYVVDPYQEEMYGYRSKRWLCSSCYDSLLGDI